MPSMTRALISVSDKTGVVEFARDAARGRRRAAVDRRHRPAAGRRRPAGDRGGRLHRLPRDARRPRQDAAPARSTAACWRAATCRRTWRRWPSTASARSTCWSSTSTRSRQTVAEPDCTLDDAIENIDIGGPAMVRAAAKNWRDVAVVIDPADYGRVLAGDAEQRGWRQRRHALSRSRSRAFAHTARLRRRDRQLPAAPSTQAGGSRASSRPPSTCSFDKTQDMRYGENPHQRAAFYRDADVPAAGALATGAPAAGQGAVVQQHRRRRRRLGVRQELRQRRRRPA